MRSSFVRYLFSVPFAIGLTLGAAATGFGASLLGSDIFADIQPGAFYDEAVGEMNELGVIKGYENGNFGPNDYVTRGQVAVMLMRFKNELSLSESSAESSSSEEEESSSSSSARSSSSSSSSSSRSYASIGAAGGIHFTIKTFTVNETAGTATVSVVRTGGNTGTVSVEYETSDGTATAGSDYTQTKGTLTYANKETSKTFQIPIGDDSATEGSETVVITLKNATNGAVLSSPDTATLTIVDNETPSSSGAASSVTIQHAVKFSAHAYAVQENAGSLTVTVVREGGTSPVTVNFSATNNGTASASDYTLTNGTLSFGQGEMSKTFSLTVADEAVVDGNKTLTLLLTTPTGGAVLGTPSSAMLTIVDNETTTSGSGSFRFSTASYSVTEGDAGLILVNRVGGNSGQVSVTYTMTNGTALSGADYTATTGTLTFAPGETSKSFQVQTIKDTVESEGGETVNLGISSPSAGASLLTPSSATLMIDS